MKQDSITNATKKVKEAPLEFTKSLIERSKKLRAPSSKADKIGTAIGSCIGAGLLLAGIVQIFTGRPLWALGTTAAGAATTLSNWFHRKKNTSSTGSSS